MTTKAVYTPPSTTETYVYAYNTANELTKQMLSGTDTNFAYDAWGRLTSKTQGGYNAWYAYRYGGKLYSVSSNFPGENAVTYYDYDGEGKRRSAAVSGGLTTTYRYDAGWNVLNEFGTNGKTYVHGPGGILADASGYYLSTGTYRYYAQDHLGSTRGLYDSNKSNIGAYEYTPYGEEYSHSGQSATPRYTGHFWDDTSDLYWAPYRFYNPALARWTTRDPLGMVDGPNVYGYVAGNPISRDDPLGQFAIWPIIRGGMVVLSGYNAYECVRCVKRALVLRKKAQDALSEEDFWDWFCAAKPGAECAYVCGAAVGWFIAAYIRVILRIVSRS